MAFTTMEEVITEERFAAKKGLKWTYDLGVPLEGLTAVWLQTANGQYFDFIQSWLDKYVDNDGNILNYSPEEFNIDHVKNGKVLLMLYKVTGKEKYLKACHNLYAQLLKHPRTKQGGFWHKKIYPYQMWVDGLYMAQPFSTEYAVLMNMPEVFDDVVNQFVYMEQNARDPKTGLLYHGWDESRQERWADPETGLSKHFWGRGIGWYVMALVDVLEHFPQDHPRRGELIAILNRTLDAVVKYQDPKSGVWYDIVDLGHREGNYLEASASSMFVYGLARSIHKGYIPSKYNKALQKAYKGLVKEFVSPVGTDRINLNGVVAVSGLGGTKNYRDGSFAYYMSEPVVSNDPKGVGPFMMAVAEMEFDKRSKKKKQVNVILDNYYNNEFKKSPTGEMKPYHYLWDGMDNNGFSLLGRVFEQHGGILHTLRSAPNNQNLSQAGIYIIVDPDTEKETEKPNFMTAQEAAEVAEWVRKGGVLVLLMNDAGNCEITKFNTLPARFGITFNEDSRNRVQGREYATGGIDIPSGTKIFRKTKRIYIKEISTLNVSKPAKVLVKDKEDIIMATAKYGKGTVFAIGDPWLYNEYVDGRKLPAEYQNFEAAHELVSWLVKQAK